MDPVDQFGFNDYRPLQTLGGALVGRHAVQIKGAQIVWYN